MLLLGSLFVIMSAFTPIFVAAEAMHDDALFINQAKSILNGNWMGRFSSLALPKGPGFPLFLAASHITGLPISITFALFHVLCAWIITTISANFIKQRYALLGLFALTVWNPIFLQSGTRRILREAIYSGQSLLVVFLTIAVLFPYRRVSVHDRLALTAGLVFGWFLITREEGIWLTPALLLIFTLSVFMADTNVARRRVVVASILMLATTSSVQVGIRLMNLVKYGTFAVTDFQDNNFNRAVLALQRLGDRRPYLYVTRSAMTIAYGVSPTFQRLRPYLDGPAGTQWGLHGCGWLPSTCGEIAAGWLPWALRDGAASIGVYKTPGSAAEFFKSVADEIEAACAAGRAPCVSPLSGRLSPLTSLEPQYLLKRGAELLQKFFPLAGLRDPLPQRSYQSDTENALYLLNQPRQALPREASTKIEGWYYQRGRDWLTIAVAHDVNYKLTIARQPSPDLVSHFHDDLASNQRLSIQLSCVSADCSLVLENQGSWVELRADQVQPGRIRIGDGMMNIDQVSRYVPKNDAGSGIRRYYLMIFVPAFALLGILALPLVILSVVLYGCEVLNQYWFIVASSCVLAGLSRFVLLLVIDVAYFPTGSYVGPAQYMFATSAFFAAFGLMNTRRTARLGRPVRAV